MVLAIFMAVVEVLTGFFSNSLISDKNQPESKSEVLAESTTQPTASLPQFSVSANLEKPPHKPSISKKPKSTVRPKSSSEAIVPSVEVNYTVQSILQALNDYRGKNGAGALSVDSKLQDYAQSRANHLKNLGKLDKHAGHKEFMGNNGFEKLGFDAVAENQSWNFRGEAKELVESFYGRSSGHNKNQLSPEYTHVGIGISGAFTNLVFGGLKK